MNDYISRKTVLEPLKMWRKASGYSEGEMNIIRAAIYEVETAPAADVAPVVHAEWKINADGYYPYCSACKEEPPGRCMTARCPSCGAKMDGEVKA